MARFRVELVQTVVETAVVWIEANNEQQAEESALLAAIEPATVEGLRFRKPIPLERFLSFPLGSGVGATNGNVCPLAIKTVIVVGKGAPSASARSFRGRGADNRRFCDPSAVAWFRL